MNYSENISIGLPKGRINLSRKKDGSLIKIVGTVLGLVAFVAVLNLFNSQIKNSFYFVSSPVQKVFWTAGESSSGFLNSIANFGSIAKENDNLKTENQKLIAQITSLQAVNDANEAQSNVSLSCQNTSFKLLMAGVIGLDGQDILSINKGSSDGVKEGMPVISQQSVLYGQITKVYKNFSQITLISNKKSVVNVKVQNNAQVSDGQIPNIPAQEIDGVVKGNSDSKAYLDLVSVDSVLAQGDVLVTSALEKTFPKDLLVGKILNVQKNDQKPFQQAEIQTFLNLSSTDNLFIITNYKQKN